MTAKEKQGFGLYFLFAFGMAWLCQVGGCMALLQQNNAVLYQLALIVTMFCPLLAVLLVQKAPSAICCKTVCLRCSLPRLSICSPRWARKSAGAAT